jgi:hypothetical protein
LAGGEYDGWRWDAFLAPAGCPLLELVGSEEGRLSWAEVRPILEQLADELAAAERDGTLPATLTADGVYVQPDGRVQLVDVPLGNGAADAGDDAEGARPPGPLALLHQVAVLGLEGTPRPAEDRWGPVRAPIPIHASGLLNRLASGEPPYESVEPFRANLQSTRGQPAQVSRTIRLGLLVVSAHFFILGLCFVGLGVLFSAAGPVSPVAVLALFGAACVLWAFLTRGGISLRVQKLALVRFDGQRASRLQCAWRTLIFWAPPVALVGLAEVKAAYFPAESWWWKNGAWLGVALWLLIHAAWALRSPGRSLPDRLAGTYLVPR